jgi:hypothetical protein
MFIFHLVTHGTYFYQYPNISRSGTYMYTHFLKRLKTLFKQTENEINKSRHLLRDCAKVKICQLKLKFGYIWESLWILNVRGIYGIYGIWCILWSFVIILWSFCDHFVIILWSFCDHFVIILWSFGIFIPVFGMLYPEKSGNPDGSCDLESAQSKTNRVSLTFSRPRALDLDQVFLAGELFQRTCS